MKSKEDALYLSKDWDIPIEFANLYASRLNWDNVSTIPMLCDAIIERFGSFLDWKLVSENHILDNNFIDKYGSNLQWRVVSTRKDLSKYALNICQNKGWTKAKIYQYDTQHPIHIDCGRTITYPY